MLKKIRHNLPMKILSVVIAILFWFMVYTNENPIETRQITIQLTPINENSLTSDNLRILNEYDREVDITVRGRKSEVDQVSASDFVAYLDFSAIKNEYVEFIEITGFDYLGEKNIIPEITGSGRVGLSVDRIIAGEIPIKVNVIGETAEGFFLVGEPTLHPASFIVTDIKSLVSEISSAEVSVDVTGMKGSEVERTFCDVYDADGNEISELKNDTAVDITIKIAKKVPIEVKLEGVPAVDHVAVSSTPDPTHVMIAGSEEELSVIDKVSTLPVNIENADVSFEATTGLQTLPAGVGYVGSGEVSVMIDIETLQEKTLVFNPFNINFRYGLSNKDYDIISNNIELVVKGRRVNLDAINESTVNAYIDVANTSDGELSLPLRVENLDNVEQITFPLVDVNIQTILNMPVYTEDIFIENKLGGKYDYELLNTAASLNVIGLSENIDKIVYANMNPTIDAADLEAGTHTVPIQITLPDGVSIHGTLNTILRITEK